MSRILSFTFCICVSCSLVSLSHAQQAGAEPKRETAIIEPYNFSENRLVNDGYYREFYENGQLFLAGSYERGTPVGEWKYFHDNGKPSKVVKYEDGKPNGEIEVRRADGTLQAKRLYKGAKREGLWITYDITGEKPLREENYVDGKPDGVSKRWHENGQLALETTFKAGKLNGVTTEWDKEGVKRGEATFVDGQREGKTTIWTPDGKVIEQNYKAGKLVTEPGK
jgi:antitoxin component YwqK of YwqJK toxin-antitoxin module